MGLGCSVNNQELNQYLGTGGSGLGQPINVTYPNYYQYWPYQYPTQMTQCPKCGYCPQCGQQKTQESK